MEILQKIEIEETFKVQAERLSIFKKIIMNPWTITIGGGLIVVIIGYFILDHFQKNNEKNNKLTIHNTLLKLYPCKRFKTLPVKCF